MVTQANGGTIVSGCCSGWLGGFKTEEDHQKIQKVYSSVVIMPAHHLITWKYESLKQCSEEPLKN